MADMNKKASELDLKIREKLGSTLIAQRDDAFERFIEANEKLTQYNFLVNAGGAIATLAFIGSEKGTYLAMGPLMCFVIGLVATGVQRRFLFNFFGILYNDVIRRLRGFLSDELTWQETRPPQDLGKWIGKLERWSGWIAQVAFVVGVLLGAFIIGKLV